MLCFIFQQSFDNSELPHDWSQAMVVPAYKKGDRDSPINYRPISLTCLACKVMEHTCIVLSHVNKHLNTYNILTYLQHGFRSGFSCETQLILVADDWAKTLNIKVKSMPSYSTSAKPSIKCLTLSLFTSYNIVA